VVVATVRPETMLGDTAVAVNPDDERHAHLIGARAILPLVGRELPIIGDDYVKVDFGTGVLKITPGHDPNDFEIGRRHGLAQVSVIGEDGLMTESAGERFAGLEVTAAREAVVQALREQGLLRAETEITHTVPFSHRSGRRIEPLISLQWFMAMEDLATPALEVVRDGRVRIHPDSQRRRYEQWLDEIRPWCVSRQLWWGHQLPVYYRGEETYVGESAPEGDGWTRDPDVLDTWFSSALWPFATLGWPKDTPELRAFYPTDVLVTARDILFLWVARMVMMGLEFTGEAPFSDVYVHSVIQAPDGRRMSKSLGTGIDPVHEIERHGADGLRFGLLAMSSSQDVRYSAEKVEQGQGLANKLFNASRFVALRVDPDAQPAPRPTAIEDRWIVSRLQRAVAETAQRLESYDFSHAALGLYDFIYGELCDWYLELVKPRLAPGSAGRAELSSTLLYVLDQTLAMAHPVIPFVTEEVWSLRGHEALLAGSSFPHAEPALVDEAAEEALSRAVDAVRALRAWRDSVGAAPRVVVPGRLDAPGYEATGELVARMARFELDGQPGEARATVAVPGGTVAVLGADGLDLGAADRALEDRRAKLGAEISRAEGRLANAGFVEKAPPPVVDAERTKLEALRSELESL
jgi:valyl-tRNA synthetase